jgi:hypothetical protein
MSSEPRSEGGSHSFHQAFGLIIRSSLALPELLPAERGAPVDIEISYGEVPTELPDALARGVRFQAAPNRLLLRIDGVASYLVSDGRRAIIERDPAAGDDDVRAFLLGPVFGALLHQRDDLVLHGSAIGVGGEGVAFLGSSGVGKSTLAAAFRNRGHPVLTDDLCVVRPGAGGRMMIYPGFPQAKLWLDSLEKLDVSSEGLRRIRSKIEKRAVPLGKAFAPAPLPVKKLYLLNPTSRPELELLPVSGPAKFDILRCNTYRFRFLADVDAKAGHFQLALQLARQVPVTVVVRPESSFCLDDLVTLIEADLRG